MNLKALYDVQPKYDIYKEIGSSWKEGQKDFKRQRGGETAIKQCFLGMMACGTH